MSAAPSTAPTGTYRRRRLLVASAAVVLLVAPLAVFAGEIGTPTYYLGDDFPPGQAAYIMMRPAGHLAFALVFIQLVLGTAGRPIARWLGLRSLVGLHMAVGRTALAMIWLHPILFLWGGSLRAGEMTVRSTFAPDPLHNYYTLHLFFGAVALYVLTIGALGALIGPRVAPRRWRQVHRLNYLALPIAWYHGYFIGSETRVGPLPVLYTLMLGGAVGLATWSAWRVSRSWRIRGAKPAHPAP